MCVSLEVQGPLPGALRWLCRFQNLAPGAKQAFTRMDCRMDVYQPASAAPEIAGWMRNEKRRKLFKIEALGKVDISQFLSGGSSGWDIIGWTAGG